MNRQGTIELAALLSLVIGAIILLGLGIKIAKVLDSDDNSDKSHYLPEIISMIFSSVDETSETQVATRSIKLGPKDLFLFFDAGVQGITLKSEVDYSKDFIFERPEECEGTTCICYCKGGAYWEKLKDDPGLRLTSLRPENPYNCTGKQACEALSQDYYFTNSRGNIKYQEQIQNNLKIDTDNFIYYPVSLDVIIILQEGFLDYLNEENWRYKNTNPLFNVEGDIFDDNHKELNYNSYSQTTILPHILKNSWEGGYVLGGFGAAQSDRNREDHELKVPPVTLRIENKGDGLFGVCIHDTCLFDDDVKKHKENFEQKKLATKLIKEWNSLEVNIKEAQSCVDSEKGDDDATATCIKHISLDHFFTPEIVALLDPSIQFTSKQGAPYSGVTRIFLQDNLQTTYTPLETGILFSCDRGFSHMEEFTLTNLKYTKKIVDQKVSYIREVGAFASSVSDGCFLSIIARENAISTTATS